MSGISNNVKPLMTTVTIDGVTTQQEMTTTGGEYTPQMTEYQQQQLDEVNKNLMKDTKKAQITSQITSIVFVIILLIIIILVLKYLLPNTNILIICAMGSLIVFLWILWNVSMLFMSASGRYNKPTKPDIFIPF